MSEQTPEVITAAPPASEKKKDPKKVAAGKALAAYNRAAKEEQLERMKTLAEMEKRHAEREAAASRLTNAMIGGNYQGIDIRRRGNAPYSHFYLEVVKGILPPYLEHILGLDDPPRRAIELSSLITVDDFVVHCDIIDERYSLINGKQSTAVGTFHNDHWGKFRWFVDNKNSNEQHTRVWYRLKDEPAFSSVTMTLKNTFGQALNTYNSSFHYTLAFK